MIYQKGAIVMSKQIGCQKFESDDKRACIYIENDMPVGVFHDFLMSVKGHIVDIMVKAQKEEEAQAEAQKKADCCAAE